MIFKDIFHNIHEKFKYDDTPLDAIDDDSKNEEFNTSNTDEYKVADSNETESDEDAERKNKRKKRIIAIIIGIGIIIAILLLGFTIRKNRVAAVLSDDLQNEMIEDLSDYINQISGDYVSKDDADDIAKQVIEDNFKDLLLSNFMSLTKEEVESMISEALDDYLSNYYTKNEITSKVNTITKKFVADLEQIRKDIDGIKTTIQELTDKTNDALADLQEQINKINSDINIKNVDTPLISYVWNTSIKNTKMTSDDTSTGSETSGTSSGTNTGTSSGDSGTGTDASDDDTWVKWNDPQDGIDWHVTKKTYDTSNMTIREYVEVLAANDIEFTKSINELYEYLNDKLTDEKNAREEADTLITNFFNTKVSELQSEIDTINQQLG